MIRTEVFWEAQSLFLGYKEFIFKWQEKDGYSPLLISWLPPGMRIYTRYTNGKGNISIGYLNVTS
jgi:hypothetical protein